MEDDLAFQCVNTGSILAKVEGGVLRILLIYTFRRHKRILST